MFCRLWHLPGYSFILHSLQILAAKLHMFLLPYISSEHRNKVVQGYTQSPILSSPLRRASDLSRFLKECVAVTREAFPRTKHLSRVQILNAVPLTCIEWHDFAATIGPALLIECRHLPSLRITCQYLVRKPSERGNQISKRNSPDDDEEQPLRLTDRICSTRGSTRRRVSFTLESDTPSDDSHSLD